jgi:uncharacterized membrane protein YfcA
MQFTNAIDPLYSVCGLGVGFLVGMTGVGGGSLMTPVLILLFGIHPTVAVGTDLLYASATKAAGSVIHGLSRTIDWVIVRRLAAGSIPSAAATLLVLSRFDIYGPTMREVVTIVLTAALFATAMLLIFRRRLLAFYARRVVELDPGPTAWLTIVAGALLGVLVSISSVGAGAIGVTILVLLYPGRPTKTIVGSDIAHAMPLTLVAGLGHWMLGSVNWYIFVSLLIGSLPGVALGSYMATRVPERALRIVLAVVLAIVGGKLLFEQIQTHFSMVAVSGMR